MKRIFKISAFIFLSFATVFSSAALLFFHVTRDAVFDENKFVRPAERTLFFDGEGNKMNSHRDGESLFVSISDLPPHVKHAFISIEDKRFYSHHGVDYRRIAGAALNNLKKHGFSEGASTISQQLIKNTHLSGEKTIARKLKEIKLTRVLERRFKKDKILETYLTEEFGSSFLCIKVGTTYKLLDCSGFTCQSVTNILAEEFANGSCFIRNLLTKCFLGTFYDRRMNRSN